MSDSSAGSDSGGGSDAATFAGYACSGAKPKFSADVTPILSGCGGGELCHSGLAPGGSAPFAYDKLVGVKATRDMCAAAGNLVTAGDPSHSYLLNKLTGVDMCAGTAQMPKGGTPLTKAHIQTIFDWICIGAPND